MICLEEEKGRIRLELSMGFMGRDVCVMLSGGDRPHLGAVAVAENDGDKKSLSHIALPGHREDELACRIAGIIGAALNVNAVVCCGIHLDNISRQEIAEVETMSLSLTEKVLQAASSYPARD